MNIRRTAILVGLVAVAMHFVSQPVFAKTGSWTIHVNTTTGKAPAGTQVRITAKTEGDPPDTYDETFDVAGMTAEQIRDLVHTDMNGAGWGVSKTGTNGIIITGKGAKAIEQVDGGDNKKNVEVVMDGNVTRVNVKPGAKFSFVCAPPNAGGAEPGVLVCSLNAHHANAPLAPGDPPEAAATSLAAALTAAGFVVDHYGAEVTLVWDEPANLALLGEEVHTEILVLEGEAGPHLQLGLPESKPTGWEDNFDTYTAGQGIHGKGGWLGWDNVAAADAMVTDKFSSSPSNSLQILTETDIVQTYSFLGDVSGGQWLFAGEVYIEAGMKGSSFFIMLNTFQHNVPSPRYWSVQMIFDGDDGKIKSYWDYPNLVPYGDIIRDQWVPFALKIDLDNDTYTFSYDGKDIYTDKWKHNTAAKNAIEALDLYGGAPGPTPPPSNGLLYYDNLSLKPVAKACAGDFNCDGVRDFNDIDEFVLALTTGKCKCANFANCDPNGDGVIDFKDIDPFIPLIGLPCP